MYLDLIKSNWHSDRSEIPQNRAIYNISQYLYNSLYVYILGYIQLLHSFFFGYCNHSHPFPSSRSQLQYKNSGIVRTDKVEGLKFF